MRTLLIALLFGFPILGEAADDWPASNWIWQLPGERSFSGQLTGPEFMRVVRELENRRLGLYGNGIAVTNVRPEIRFVDFNPLNRLSGEIVEPQRNSQSVEAAEIVNGLRMDGYRRHCETLRHGELQGTPALYPTQIPWLGSP